MIQLPEEGQGKWSVGWGKSRGRIGYYSTVTLVLIKITLIRINSVYEIYRGKTCFFTIALCSSAKNHIDIHIRILIPHVKGRQWIVQKQL